MTLDLIAIWLLLNLLVFVALIPPRPAECLAYWFSASVRSCCFA